MATHPQDSGEARGSLRDLDPEERLLLLRFVCSFAWADFEVKPEEREFVVRLMRRLRLDAAEERCVLAWLESPPPPESVDPRRVPRAHRMKFLRAIESIVSVDGKVSPEEREGLLLFDRLTR